MFLLYHFLPSKYVCCCIKFINTQSSNFFSIAHIDIAVAVVAAAVAADIGLAAAANIAVVSDDGVAAVGARVPVSEL